MVKINTHTEWHELKEVVVGTAVGAQIPLIKDKALHAINYGHLSDEDFKNVRTGPYPRQVIDETNEDLDRLSEGLKDLGIKVHRPKIIDFSEVKESEHWKVDGCHAICPRDSVLTIGNQAIQTPMALRHRQNEAEILDNILEIIKTPVPKLLDTMYDMSTLGVPTLKNHESVFDAANCLKIGRDILFLISNTGNHAGAEWLQRHLGNNYRVHAVEGVYSFMHIDSTITVLRPGLVLLCPDRVKESNLPKFFRNWDKIYAPEPETLQTLNGWGGASKWIAMNLLSIRPDLVAIGENQISLMKLLKTKGIESFPVRLRHTRTIGAGPHCVTLDIYREGVLEDYTV